jgi:hypothetical protein
MTDTVNDCPQYLELLLYASDEHPADKHQQIFVHLQTCRDCRYRLDWCHDALRGRHATR